MQTATEEDVPPEVLTGRITSVVGLVTLLVLVLVLAPVAGASSAAATVAQLGDRSAKVSGYGDVLAWSAFDERLKRYRLVVKVGDGEARRVKVRSRSLPFDVDVGPDRDGRPLLVYSRCRSEPPPNKRAAPKYAQAKGCDLYSYEVASGTERLLDGLSTDSESEYMPSIWRGDVAFARRRGRKGIPRLYVRRAGTRRSRRVGAGPSPLNDYDNDGPMSLDLRGRRLAYDWRYTLDGGCYPGPSGSRADTPTYADASEIRVVEPGHKPQRITRGCTQRADVPEVSGVAWMGPELIYTETRSLARYDKFLLSRSLDGQVRQLAFFDGDRFGGIPYLTTSDIGIVGSIYDSAPPPGLRIAKLTG